jgi:hypothetical protein
MGKKVYVKNQIKFFGVKFFNFSTKLLCKVTFLFIHHLGSRKVYQKEKTEVKTSMMLVTDFK